MIFTNQKTLKKISKVERYWEHCKNELKKRLDTVEIKFPIIDVSQIILSEKEWTVLPEAIGHGVSGLGLEFTEESTKIKNIYEKGAYMIPHYHSKSETTIIESGSMMFKIFDLNGEMIDKISLKKGDMHVIKENVIHAVESIEKCTCIHIWK